MARLLPTACIFMPIFLLLCSHSSSSWAQQMAAADRISIKTWISQLDNPSAVRIINCDNVHFFCLPNGRVKSIYLGGLKLAGALTSSLGSLSFLTSLLVQNNKLRGAVPSSFAKLTNLQTLYLNNNQLSGVLPAGLSKLTKLQRVNVADNLFGGVVPFSAAQIKKLITFSMSNNYLNKGPSASSCGAISKNCMIGANRPPACPLYEQRPSASCLSFCNATQLGGYCGGRGTCVLSRKKYTCVCQKGYSNKKSPHACVKA